VFGVKPERKWLQELENGSDPLHILYLFCWHQFLRGHLILHLKYMAYHLSANDESIADSTSEQR